ncbi:MAG TPA: glycoside hydrolase family 15 protein [Bryobacteraceae bacterium]|nr:glycoside hydrolase family 15 protein [Bryobacteraceae bacterium]
MPQLIEDYAVIGNNATAALVGKNGSIDWLGFPRFDSASCFSALLGSEKDGHWAIAPLDQHAKATRRYRPGTLVLETDFETPEGVVRLIDCMDRRGEHQDVIRIVHGLRGRVRMRFVLIIRFEYGLVVPWVTRLDDGRLRAVAGPDQIIVAAPVETRGEDLKTVAYFDVNEGDTFPFSITWTSSFSPIPQPFDPEKTCQNVTHAWEKWSSQHKPKGKYAEIVQRSLITLKALTHHHTGGIVAAATTSLPEEIAGERNWDYRYCWLRDSTLTLYALMEAGFTDEAKAWREWLLRCVAGSPERMQIMYGVAGERRLTEFELTELQGYEGSSPVRIGNAASEQLQLDVYGEVMDSFYQARKKGLPKLEAAWNLQRSLMERLQDLWILPDRGMWEIRGKPQHFVQSKVMAWVAFDRAIRTMEEFGEEGPIQRWTWIRNEIQSQVLRFGFSRELNSFVQCYGSKELDASVLMLPLVGFIKADDPRMLGTVEAIEKRLMPNGFVARYNTASAVDGVPGAEGAFLACTFWLVDNYVLQKRMGDAYELFDRCLCVLNDVGLLSEEYDPAEKRQLGNFPQAFSHLALVNSAHNLTAVDEEKPAHQRSKR